MCCEVMCLLYSVSLPNIAFMYSVFLFPLRGSDCNRKLKNVSTLFFLYSLVLSLSFYIHQPSQIRTFICICELFIFGLHVFNVCIPTGIILYRHGIYSMYEMD